MAPLSDAELQQRLAASSQVRKYREPINRVSAEEKLEGQAASSTAAAPAATGRRAPSTLETILRSPVTRSVAVTISGAIARGIMNTILRRRR
jgi:hypothetical protein